MKSFQLQKRDGEMNDEVNDEVNDETLRHEMTGQPTNERNDLESLKASNQLN